MQKVFLVDKHGEVIWPGEFHTKQYPWVNAGVITAVVAVGQAPIDDDKRADANIVALDDSKKVIYEPTNGTVAFEVRFRADGNEGDVFPLQMLSAAGVDHYTKIADLACTQGTQDGHSTEHFIDAIAQTNNAWLATPRIVDAEADYIARYVLHTHGYDRFLFVCTDLKNANNLYIDVHRL